MLFYILHNLNHNLIPWSSTAREGQKNVLTFVLGACLYFFIWGWLTEPSTRNKLETTPFLSILMNFFGYFIVIDILAMACLYKNFFQRSILNEASEVLGQVETYDGTNLEQFEINTEHSETTSGN